MNIESIYNITSNNIDINKIKSINKDLKNKNQLIVKKGSYKNIIESLKGEIIKSNIVEK